MPTLQRPQKQRLILSLVPLALTLAIVSHSDIQPSAAQSNFRLWDSAAAHNTPNLAWFGLLPLEVSPGRFQSAQPSLRQAVR